MWTTLGHRSQEVGAEQRDALARATANGAEVGQKKRKIEADEWVAEEGVSGSSKPAADEKMIGRLMAPTADALGGRSKAAAKLRSGKAGAIEAQTSAVCV